MSGIDRAWVRVYSSPLVFEARFVQSILTGAGLVARLKNEHLTGLAGALPINQCLAEVWVRSDDETAAQEALGIHLRGALSIAGEEPGRLSVPEEAAGESSPTGDGEAACPSCGEQNPPGFEVCWNCESAIDDTQH